MTTTQAIVWHLISGWSTLVWLWRIASISAFPHLQKFWQFVIKNPSMNATVWILKKRNTRSIILTATPAMAGSHSCLRGHIRLVVIRAFVASHANVSITRFLGQIFKHALRINQGFCLNVSPSNKESDPNVPLQIFGILVKLTWFSHFFREFSFVVIMRFLGGTFGQNLVMGGTKTF